MESLKAQNDEINKLSINMEDAVDSALKCHRITQTTLQHCLALNGKHTDVRHISLLIECGELSRLAAQFMIATSDFTHDICGICARICDATSDSCHDVDPEDPHLNACMVACRECADSCRNMEH